MIEGQGKPKESEDGQECNTRVHPMLALPWCCSFVFSPIPSRRARPVATSLSIAVKG